MSLLDGLRGFIATNDLDSMKAALGKVMDGLRLLGSHTKITQIATALFVFQEAVNSTLRQQSIKPHWIFALDKLLRYVCHELIYV